MKKLKIVFMGTPDFGVPILESLIKNIVNGLAPIQEKRHYYEERPNEVKEILEEGTKKAKIEAAKTMEKVKTAMKLDYFKN